MAAQHLAAIVRCDPAAKRPFDLMDFPQFSWRERRNAVRFAERLQLVFRVDAPRFGAGLNQSRLSGLFIPIVPSRENIVMIVIPLGNP